MAFAMLLREIVREKSDENWDAGRLCRDNSKFNAAISRFYYAVYLSTRYWADKKGLLACTDKGVRDIHATMVGIIGNNAGNDAKEFRAIVNNLKELRVTADYYPEHVGYSGDVQMTVKKASAIRSFFLQ